VFKGGVRAVDGIELTVRRGEIYGFLGPNGAGKSTTVHVLTTLLPPTSGRALVGGFDVATQGAAVRRIIGAALQEVALDPILTGREHLAMQAALHGTPRIEAAKRAAELLDRVGLSDAADRRTGGYSGGMKRRLDLALALVHRPQILFLDEPTTGLDVQSRTALWDEVRDLAHDDGVTIFLTTQYLEEADALADNVGIIDRGRIVAEGTPAQLKADIGRPTVEVVPERQRDRALVERVLSRFGDVAKGTRRGSLAVQIEATDGGLTRVVRELDRSRAQVANVELHRPTLADVFLAKTGRALEGADADGESEE
jgi:ABC-2 type transport system ATP-binding protein